MSMLFKVMYIVSITMAYCPVALARPARSETDALIGGAITGVIMVGLIALYNFIKGKFK